MTFRLLQIQTFECSVCRQHYNEENVYETTFHKKLYGAKAYAVCPCCGMDVDTKTMKNRAYRKRADKWRATHNET